MKGFLGIIFFQILLDDSTRNAARVRSSSRTVEVFKAPSYLMILILYGFY